MNIAIAGLMYRQRSVLHGKDLRTLIRSHLGVLPPSGKATLTPQ